MNGSSDNDESDSGDESAIAVAAPRPFVPLLTALRAGSNSRSFGGGCGPSENARSGYESTLGKRQRSATPPSLPQPLHCRDSSATTLSPSPPQSSSALSRSLSDLSSSSASSSSRPISYTMHVECVQDAMDVFRMFQKTESLASSIEDMNTTAATAATATALSTGTTSALRSFTLVPDTTCLDALTVTFVIGCPLKAVRSMIRASRGVATTEMLRTINYTNSYTGEACFDEYSSDEEVDLGSDSTNCSFDSSNGIQREYGE